MKSKGGDSGCWKSILGSKQLIEAGAWKRVGDGKIVDIWKDKWIPEAKDRRIQSNEVQISKFQRSVS